MNLFRHLLFWILLALAGALIAQVLIRDPGYVLVRYGGYDIQTTLVSGVLLAAAAAFVLWLVWKLIALPFRLWRRRRERTARARFGEGLEALDQGHYARAETLLRRAAAVPQFEVAALTAAARAALARGDRTGAETHLDALAERRPAAAATRAVALAEAALAEGRSADALAALDAIPGQAPPRALALRAEALAAGGQGAQAYGMLGALRQQQALPAETLAARERDWSERALREAADANMLADTWDALPPALRNDAAVVRAYADRAAALRWEDAAAGSLEQAIDAQWHEGLAAHYGALPIGQLERRRGHAERWLAAHPASPGALIGLARLLRAQGQWPQAEVFLHRAIAQGGSADAWEDDAWEELGHGFAQAGDDARARLCYANALAVLRGEATAPLPGRDLKQRIRDEAAIEERDEHGVPRLRG